MLGTIDGEATASLINNALSMYIYCTGRYVSIRRYSTITNGLGMEWFIQAVGSVDRL